MEPEGAVAAEAYADLLVAVGNPLEDVKGAAAARTP